MLNMSSPSTREIPIAVPPTRMAVTTALDELESELRTFGLGIQADRLKAIRLALWEMVDREKQRARQSVHDTILGKPPHPRRDHSW